MDGPFWSFVLGLAPVRRRLRREINQARQEIERAARVVRDQDRQRYQAVSETLARSERHARQLSQSISELKSDNRDLSDQVAELRSSQRPRNPQRLRDDAAAIKAHDTTSDLFRCEQDNCGALWLLSMRPDHSYSVSGPIGPGCEICTSNTLLRLLKVKAAVTEPHELARVARPSSTPPQRLASLPVPGADRAARTDFAVRFVADLMQRGEDAAVANVLAHQAIAELRGEVDENAPATSCTGLSAVADGLDQASNVIRDGVAWCATEIFGLPDFLAELLGELVRRTVELHVAPVHAAHAVAQGVRAFGAASCMADDHLGDCQCARKLIGNLGEKALAVELKQFIERIGDDFGTIDQEDWWHDIGGV